MSYLDCYYWSVGMCTTPMLIMKAYCKDCDKNTDNDDK